jgi:hypothetical protein
MTAPGMIDGGLGPTDPRIVGYGCPLRSWAVGVLGMRFE